MIPHLAAGDLKPAIPQEYHSVYHATLLASCLIRTMKGVAATLRLMLACIIGSNLILPTAGFRSFGLASAGAASSKLLIQYPMHRVFDETAMFPTDLSTVPVRPTTAVQRRVSLVALAEIHPPDVKAFQDDPINANSKRKHLSEDVLVTVIVVPVGVASLILCLLLTWLCRSSSRKDGEAASAPQRHPQNTDPSDSRILAIGSWLKHCSFRYVPRKRGPACALDYAHLQAATNNFSTDNLLGRGTFGCVFKARLGEDFFAAVKQLDDKQKNVERDFETEVEITSKIRHPNLVSLLGYSTHGKQRLLVYELMQNGSLEDQLHGPARGSALTWNLRMKIALDVARGLEHLHEHCSPAVIHRDFKSSNILLDASFNAKVSDFGLAVVCSESGEERNIELQGTFGYVAPEYLLNGTLSEKSDVYAFGVVLLELITGRKPIDTTMPTGCQSLVTWATPQLTDRPKLADILDPALQNDYMNLKQLYQLAAIAALCVQSEPSYRPLITDVVNSLIPLVPIELGGALRSAESRFVEELKTISFSEHENKSFSFSDYNAKFSESQEHVALSTSARMADFL